MPRRPAAARRVERREAGKDALEEHIAKVRVVLHAEARTQRLGAAVDLQPDGELLLVEAADEAFAGVGLDSIETITACDNNILKVKFSDGSEHKYVWKDRDRRDSWTPEMKEQARQKYIERMMSDG